MLQKIVGEIIKSLDNECYFAALALALTLPDICGKAEFPEDGVGDRYKKWCNQYVCESEKPASPHGDDMPYLSAETLYSLRNSLLHQGTPNVDGEKIHEERCKVDKFALIITDENSVNGGTSRIAYGQNMEIVEREQTVSIRHICYILRMAAQKYYNENSEKFNFINYRLIDERGKL